MHFFISDAHIRTDESYRARMLIKFLHENKAKMTDLYILGDLFEFWFEYNIVFPKDYFKTLAALYNLIQDGKTVHYIMGNHEVMIGRFLRNFGFVVHPEQTTVKIDGKTVYLAHGNKIDVVPTRNLHRDIDDEHATFGTTDFGGKNFHLPRWKFA